MAFVQKTVRERGEAKGRLHEWLWRIGALPGAMQEQRKSKKGLQRL
jgi:hypothetical protein